MRQATRCACILPPPPNDRITGTGHPVIGQPASPIPLPVSGVSNRFGVPLLTDSVGNIPPRRRQVSEHPAQAIKRLAAALPVAECADRLRAAGADDDRDRRWL